MLLFQLCIFYAGVGGKNIFYAGGGRICLNFVQWDVTGYLARPWHGQGQTWNLKWILFDILFIESWIDILNGFEWIFYFKIAQWGVTTNGILSTPLAQSEPKQWKDANHPKTINVMKLILMIMIMWKYLQSLGSSFSPKLSTWWPARPRRGRNSQHSKTKSFLAMSSRTIISRIPGPGNQGGSQKQRKGARSHSEHYPDQSAGGSASFPPSHFLLKTQQQDTTWNFGPDLSLNSVATDLKSRYEIYYRVIFSTDLP